ncbi:hypothetical protein [Sphingomonas sp. CFBP 13720]|uniref:hypothetical protein n=1 Tax=Sphingomonas sp. CFBP 13720 TaxID=2775302 RepID=UPI001781AE59|nr:hypothetical protein [Sphingomonas sp. CFBP 13720]MBD8677998.1 hypothetical protein [Sphingomonas sp. CFBP 13720]
MARMLPFLFAAFLLLIADRADAQQNAFDLAGPELSITVTRAGVELPITAVPSLRGGDRLRATARFPADQSARYRLVIAFLRGATNPPPRDWFYEVRAWHPKKNLLDVTVPQGAEQAMLFLAPEAGGGFAAVLGAVRGRPGIFVRAAQDLHQASLDRARLDAFVAAIGRIGDTAPERLVTAAPILANALRIKLNAECLTRQRALQSACLTQSRDALVLQAQRGTTLTETLTGTPVDLAYRVAATPEGGAGYYSPYIGLARDVARLFGAFRSAQYQYLPALTLNDGADIRLQLNAAPSFQNPRSVLVAPLPPIGATPPPVWRSAAPAAVCLARPGAVLPLDDASLLFATGYARDLRLAIEGADGTTATLPVVVDAEQGGLRLAEGTDLTALGPVDGATLQGSWGFDRFDGPRLPVQLDRAGAWRPQPDGFVVVGRDHPLALRGGASSCIERLALRDATDGNWSLSWKTVGADEVEAVLPLGRVRPGPLTLSIGRHGAATPDTVRLTGRVEPSRLDRFVVHAGDRSGMLDGARLDQVTRLDLGTHRFMPGALTRGPDGDQLEMTTDRSLEPDDATKATVTLRDARTASVGATIAPSRPTAKLLDLDATIVPVPGAAPIALPDGLVPAGATLTFSFRPAGAPLGDRDAVEVATDQDAGPRLTFAAGTLQRVGDIVVATLAPPPGAPIAGRLRFRLIRDGATGDWQPLARAVRLPAVTALECPQTGDCTIAGRNLFLVAGIAGTPDGTPTLVPPGFVGTSLALPSPAKDAVFLRLHDAPDVPLRVAIPK